MEKDFKFFITKLVKSTTLILITSLMHLTPRTEGKELLLCSCICKNTTPIPKSSVLELFFLFFFLNKLTHLIATISDLMLKKVVKQFFLLPRETSVQGPGTRIYLNVLNRVYP